MKHIRTVGTLSLVGFVALTAPLAVADDSDWYGGIGIGQSAAKIHNDRIRAGLQGSGFTATSIQDDERDTGFKLFGGKKLSPNFAIEGGYFNLGEFGFTANTTPTGSLTGNVKFQGVNLDAVGMLPLAERLSVLGRVGLTYTQARASFQGTGAVTVNDPDPKKNEGNFKVGLGLQYDVTPALGLRTEVERYRVNDAIGNKGDVDMLSVGLVYAFGGTKSKTSAAPPPAEQPVARVAPVVVAKRTQQYCSLLDIQFEINQTTVQREAEEKINKVGIFMRKYPDTTAVIEGHSDEVGTAGDNLKLSQQRADSVVTYLVDHDGIARSRLKAVGYGDTRPIGDNKTEAGKRLNRRINAVIACATDIEGIVPIPGRITMAMEMEFDTNRAELRPQYHDELRKVANFMKANPKVAATVEGHTSNQQGTPAQGMELSKRRAENVVSAMVNQFGVDRSRLTAVGFGENRRLAYNTSVEGRQDNRRVNIVLDFPS